MHTHAHTHIQPHAWPHLSNGKCKMQIQRWNVDDENANVQIQNVNVFGSFAAGKIEANRRSCTRSEFNKEEFVKFFFSCLTDNE